MTLPSGGVEAIEIKLFRAQIDAAVFVSNTALDRTDVGNFVDELAVRQRQAIQAVVLAAKIKFVVNNHD